MQEGLPTELAFRGLKADMVGCVEVESCLGILGHCADYLVICRAIVVLETGKFWACVLGRPYVCLAWGGLIEDAYGL